jgi:hypothetical protein
LKPLDEFVEHFFHAALLDTHLPNEGNDGQSGTLAAGQALPIFQQCVQAA